MARRCFRSVDSSGIVVHVAGRTEDDGIGERCSSLARAAGSRLQPGCRLVGAYASVAFDHARVFGWSMAPVVTDAASRWDYPAADLVYLCCLRECWRS